MAATIREWSNVDFSLHHTDQEELQRMTKKILENADKIENKPTPGHSTQSLSRVIIATSTVLSDTQYIIHVNGFEVSNITEIVQS